MSRRQRRQIKSTQGIGLHARQSVSRGVENTGHLAFLWSESACHLRLLERIEQGVHSAGRLRLELAAKDRRWRQAVELRARITNGAGRLDSARHPHVWLRAPRSEARKHPNQKLERMSEVERKRPRTRL